MPPQELREDHSPDKSSINKHVSEVDNGSGSSIVDGVHVVFTDVTYSVPIPVSKKKKIDSSSSRSISKSSDGQKGKLTILRGLSGAFAPGKMTALMGPSGSGKSTLLDVLCGRKNSGILTGSILFNGARASKSFSLSSDRTVNVQKLVGYVEQFDTLVGELTVSQMLAYTAALKLPKGTTAAERQQRVDEVISMLDLSSCRDTTIGSPLVRGISGGQAKRVNIGLAMITRPQILLLDEPTSGLDSRTADEVVLLLKQLARGDDCSGSISHDGQHPKRRTVVCTIHSPTGRAFSQFDDLHMLHGGRTIYDGPVNMVQNHFEKALGYPRDLDCSLPEWLVDLTSDMPPVMSATKQQATTHKQGVVGTAIVEEEGEEGRGPVDFSNLFQNSQAQRASLKRLEIISASFATNTNARYNSSSQYDNNSPTTTKSKLEDSSSQPPPGVSEWRKLGTLLRYRTVAHYRDGQFLSTRFMTKIVFALLILSLYFGIGEQTDSQSIASTASLLYFISSICGYGAAAFVPSLTLERNLYYRELADGCYKPGTYFMAKFMEEGILATVTSLVFCVIVFFGCKLQGSFFIFVVSYYLTTMMGIVLAYAVAAVAPSMEAANAILPTLVTIWMYFGGLYIVFDKIPVGWYWFSWTSFIRYSWGAMLLNQFQDQVNGELPVFFGDEGEPLNVLEFYGMRAPIMGSIGTCLGLLVGLLAAFAGVGILGLKFVRHDKR